MTEGKVWIMDMYFARAEELVVRWNTEIALGHRKVPRDSYYEIGESRRQVVDIVGIYLVIAGREEKETACKMCGRTGFRTGEREFEKFEREAYEKLKDKSCDELLEIWRDAFYSFDHFVAERLLLERGH